MPLQGGYVAKWCPVRAQNDTIRPTEPLRPSRAVERRLRRGLDFERSILERLSATHSDLIVLDPNLHGEDAIAATINAIQSGAQIIFGGRLPPDEAGRRVGKPDVLVRADTGGHRPVDVKHHQNLQAFDAVPALCAELDDPRWEAAIQDPAFSARKRKEDLLQLAHYQRILEALGLEANEGRFGGIIGVEGRVTWYDLDAPMWRTPSSSGKQKWRTTMEVYDFEFDFRLDIIAVAQQHLADASVDPLLVPVRISQCPECPWWVHCGPQLEAGAGDVSLLPSVGWRQWSAHRDRSVHDRLDLAKLDHRTATLVGSGIDVAALMERAKDADPASAVAEIIGGRRPAQLARLMEAGVRTAGDVLQLSTETASYSGSGLSSLPAQIDLARAALGPEPVYLRRGVERVELPRGDVELDIDLENVEEGVYLWGTLVTDRSGSGVQTGYRPFVTWEPLNQEVEVSLFEQLWAWLSELRARVHGAGKTLRIYCYNDTVERGHLLRLATIAGHEAEVRELVESDDWVDLLRVFSKHLITGTSIGLKATAQLAGYQWPVEDPGGDDSMVVYDTAVDGPAHDGRDDARTWLLDYNRGDVEATLALREWMDDEAPNIRPIETVVPKLLGDVEVEVGLPHDVTEMTRKFVEDSPDVMERLRKS